MAADAYRRYAIIVSPDKRSAVWGLKAKRRVVSTEWPGATKSSQGSPRRAGGTLLYLAKQIQSVLHSVNNLENQYVFTILFLKLTAFEVLRSVTDDFLESRRVKVFRLLILQEIAGHIAFFEDDFLESEVAGNPA